MSRVLKRFANNQSGATSIEYSLICAGIAVALITIIQNLGTNLVTLLSNLLAAFG